ncbi:MAG: acetyl-CoA carboxylase carboxyltransferase subunit alpha [Pirellulales bacterium]|nr:acetyl-CoA carboxylase carboxyltransferase subunit alpha [Pirellulales bacterium]
MASEAFRLDFEEPIYALEKRVRQLEATEPKSAQLHEELRAKRRELADVTRTVYSQLDAWQIVRVARYPDRPKFSDYTNMVFDEFVELHGDKFYGDDRALQTGFAKLNEYKILLVGHQKGKTLKERNECYFGCAHPEGYRKAMAKMRLAAKFKMPIICLIDTPGAYPGIGAEERGQAQVIAESMFTMSLLPVPIICVVIGEGGSGGALGIGVGDRVGVLQFAYYSVISPEGCAGILWKSHKFAEDAARALRLTSDNLLELGAVDDVIEEPLGAAHRNPHQMATRLKIYLLRTLRELLEIPEEELLARRYARFRRIGHFIEEAPACDLD